MSSPAPLVIDVDLKVYSLSAIKTACYKLADKLTSQIDGNEHRAKVSLWPKQANASISESEIRSAFLTELGDQDLREVVKRETEAVAQLILAQAFSRTSLIE